MSYIYLVTFYLSLLSTSLSASEIKTTTIGAVTDQTSITHEKQEIELIQYRSGKASAGNRRFFIQGGLHGNEVLTSKFVQWIIKRLEKNKSKLNKLKDIEIDFVPIANPDVYGKSRLNSNNVNLNRNFSVLWGVSSEPAGSGAFSEAETKAISNLFKKRNYLSAIDIHGYVNWVVLPSNLSNKKPGYRSWVKETRKNMRYLPRKYKIKFAGELGDGGAFEDWAFWKQNSFSSCLEMIYKKRYLPDNTDTFLAYENYIFHSFKSALKIKNRTLREAISSDDETLSVNYQKTH